MLRVRDASLSEKTQRQLNEYQNNIDAISNYAERVLIAQKEFTNKNRQENAIFKEVRDVFRTLCTGTLRCMYCEDLQPNQVEHIKPKSLYPEMFLFGKTTCTLAAPAIWVS